MEESMKRVLLASAVLLVLTALPARALPVLDFQLGAHYVDPTSDFVHEDGGIDGYDSGFGAYARMRAPVGPGRLAGAVTWNRLDGSGNSDDLEFLTFQAGPHYSFSALSVGLEVAYLGEFEEWGYSPMVTLAVMKFEGTVAYTSAFDKDVANWLSFGLGWRF
jgi:hypothetical protein